MRLVASSAPGRCAALDGNRHGRIVISQLPPLPALQACEPVLKTLLSAAANAKQNLGLRKAKLVVSECFADEGPVLKRAQPRAQVRRLPESAMKASLLRGTRRSALCLSGSKASVAPQSFVSAWVPSLHSELPIRPLCMMSRSQS